MLAHTHTFGLAYRFSLQAQSMQLRSALDTLQRRAEAAQTPGNDSDSDDDMRVGNGDDDEEAASDNEGQFTLCYFEVLIYTCELKK